MNADNRWKRKADALTRLAEDQRGKPEGELARQKLQEIIAKHPEAKDYGPVRDLLLRDLKGIDLEGSWTAATPQEAIAMVIADYRQRIAARDAAQPPAGRLRG